MRPLRSRLVPAAAVIAVGVLVASASLPVVTGCTTRQCDADCVIVGGGWTDQTSCAVDGSHAAGFGELAKSTDGSTLVWETSAQYGTWLDFPGQRTFLVTWPQAMTDFIHASGGYVITVDPYVSTTQTNPGWSSVVNATGQLAEWGGVDDSGFQIFNATCEEYYLRVVVTVTALAPADAGAAE